MYRVEYEWCEGEVVELIGQMSDWIDQDRLGLAAILATMGLLSFCLVAGMAMVVGVSLYLGAGHSPGWYLVTAFSSLLLLFAVACVWAIMRSIRRNYTNTPSLSIDQYLGLVGEFRLTREGVFNCLTGAEETMPWPRVRRICVSEYAVSIISERHRLIALPRRYVSTDRELDELIHLVRLNAGSDVRCNRLG